MSLGLNHETFDGYYQDHLVKRLLAEERRERQECFDEVRGAFTDYRRRVASVIDGPDYFHQVLAGTGIINGVVLLQNLVGSHVGPYDYLWLESVELEGEALITVQESIAVARHHNAYRRETVTTKEYVSPPHEGFRLITSTKAPRSNYAPDNRREEFASNLRYLGFAPEIHWNPLPGEQFEVKEHLLGAATILNDMDMDTVRLAPGPIGFAGIHG